MANTNLSSLTQTLQDVALRVCCKPGGLGVGATAVRRASRAGAAASRWAPST